jgi:hypothetical protein
LFNLWLCRTLLEEMAFQEATVHPGGVAVQLAPARRRGPPAGAGGAGGEAAELRTVPARGADDAVRAHPSFAALSTQPCRMGRYNWASAKAAYQLGDKCLGKAAELRTASASGAITQAVFPPAFVRSLGTTSAKHRWYACAVALYVLSYDWCVIVHNA